MIEKRIYLTFKIIKTGINSFNNNICLDIDDINYILSHHQYINENFINLLQEYKVIIENYNLKLNL